MDTIMLESAQTGKLKDDAVYDDQTFQEINMKELELCRTEFTNCKFVRCKYNGTIFSKCRFENCSFIECDLSLMKPIQSSFVEVYFDNSKCIGINWTTSAKPLIVNFLHSIVNYSIFFGIDIRNIVMTTCIAKEVDFAEANLTGGTFNHTNLLGSRFLKTNMTKTDFSNAFNYVIDPNLNKLSKTKFSLPEAVSLLSVFDIILT